MSGWKVAAATSIGTSHLKTGAPCQDAHKCALVDSPSGAIFVGICADGAGSALRSDEGSRIAVETLLERITSHLSTCSLDSVTRIEISEWLAEATGKIAALAETEGLASRDFACTLVGFAISLSHAIYFQVGDGAIVLRSKHESEWCYVFWPTHGEYLNTTVFITDPAALELLQFDSRADEITEIAAFTDGIESLVLHYGTQQVHGPFFDSVIRPVSALTESGINEKLSSQLEGFLSSDVICERTDDDKTLVLASRLD